MYACAVLWLVGLHAPWCAWDGIGILDARVAARRRCLECGGQSEWASVTLGAYLCLACAGRHRQSAPLAKRTHFCTDHIDRLSHHFDRNWPTGPASQQTTSISAHPSRSAPPRRSARVSPHTRGPRSMDVHSTVRAAAPTTSCSPTSCACRTYWAHLVFPSAQLVCT